MHLFNPLFPLVSIVFPLRLGLTRIHTSSVQKRAKFAYIALTFIQVQNMFLFVTITFHRASFVLFKNCFSSIPRFTNAHFISKLFQRTQHPSQETASTGTCSPLVSCVRRKGFHLPSSAGLPTKPSTATSSSRPPYPHACLT